MRRSLTVILAVALGLLTGAQATANIITFSETVIATGSLGGLAFTNTAVTITQIADTANVTSPSAGVFVVNDIESDVRVPPLGVATVFQFPMHAFASGTIAGLAGGTVANPGSTVLGVANAALASYDLRTAIGPLSGAPSFSPGTPFATSAGDLIITSVSGDATFRATNGFPAPEPSTYVLISIFGALGVVVAWRRRGTR